MEREAQDEAEELGDTDFVKRLGELKPLEVPTILLPDTVLVRERVEQELELTDALWLTDTVWDKVWVVDTLMDALPQEDTVAESPSAGSFVPTAKSLRAAGHVHWE